MNDYSSLNTYHYEDKSLLSKVVDALSMPLRTALGGREVYIERSHAREPSVSSRIFWGVVAAFIAPISLLGFAAKYLSTEKTEIDNKITSVAKFSGIVPPKAQDVLFDLLKNSCQIVNDDFDRVNPHGLLPNEFLTQHSIAYYKGELNKIDAQPLSKQEKEKLKTELNGKMIEAFQHLKPVPEKGVQIAVQKGDFIEQVPVDLNTFNLAHVKSAFFVQTGILPQYSHHVDDALLSARKAFDGVHPLKAGDTLSIF